jgi:hypothetical protein
MKFTCKKGNSCSPKTDLKSRRHQGLSSTRCGRVPNHLRIDSWQESSEATMDESRRGGLRSGSNRFSTPSWSIRVGVSRRYAAKHMLLLTRSVSIRFEERRTKILSISPLSLFPQFDGLIAWTGSSCLSTPSRSICVGVCRRYWANEMLLLTQSVRIRFCICIVVGLLVYFSYRDSNLQNWGITWPHEARKRRMKLRTDGWKWMYETTNPRSTQATYETTDGRLKLDYGLIHKIMEGFFAERLTEEPNHGTLDLFIIRYRFIRHSHCLSKTLTTSFHQQNMRYIS